MDIRKLEVFCKVVELKSFTRTAEAVLLSQPTVSEHIRNLEEEIGQKLVDRLGREVEPTPVGQLLYEYAKKILRLQQEAIQAVEQYSGNLIGRIMIGSGTIPGTYILPHLIGAFRREYPDIKATLRIAGSRLIAKEVLSGDLEFGVVGAKWNDTSLLWDEIFYDQLTVVVSAEHRWAGQEYITIDELFTEPFILRELASGTRRVVEQIFQEHGYKMAQLQEVAEIGSTSAVKEAVRAGLGVAILSTMAVADDVRCGSLATVTLQGVTMERPFYLIRRKNRELSPIAAIFHQYMLQKATNI